MEVKGNLTVKSIVTSHRSNEDLVFTEVFSTINLTKFSAKHQYLLTDTQKDIIMPDATTLEPGWIISFYSSTDSTSKFYIKDYDENLLAKLSAKKSITFILLENTTTAGVWRQIKSGSGSGLGQGNVLLYTPNNFVTVSGNTFTLKPFVANVMNGIDDAGDVDDETVFTDIDTTVTIRSVGPLQKFIYITLDGQIYESEYRQLGGNIYPSVPRDGMIFFHKPLRCNFKYDHENGWQPFPCTAVCEYSWDGNGTCVVYPYPKNEWWWDYKYGDVRNTTIISSGPVVTVPDLSAYTQGDTVSGVKVGNIVATVADGYSPAGLPIDYYVHIVPQYEVEYKLGTDYYYYADTNGTIIAETHPQNGGEFLPDPADYLDGDIFYSLDDGANFKLESGAWVKWPAVCLAYIDATGTPFVYTFNVHPFSKDFTFHSQIFFNASEQITEVTLSEEVVDKDVLTVNVCNTLIQSDRYEILPDNKTIHFYAPIEAGLRIEVRWLTKSRINFMRNYSAHNVGEVFWSQSNKKEDNKGALPLFTGESVSVSQYTALHAFILRNASAVLKSKAEYDTLIMDTSVDCPYYAIDNGMIYLPLLRTYINSIHTTPGSIDPTRNGTLNVEDTTLYPWVSYVAQLGNITTADEYARHDLSNVAEISPESAVASLARNVGEIVTSTIPLADAGLHLLDGSLLVGTGVYSTFVNYIYNLYTAAPTASYFTTEASWQEAVSNYGVCGKFVYDPTNNTVRLPKVEGFTEGTLTAASLGTIVEAGLPNITGYVTTIVQGQDGGVVHTDGAMTWEGYTINSDGGEPRAGGTIHFDASRSNPIYSRSSTVQPQAVKVLYYIVIANQRKNLVTMDINRVEADLQNKADKDLVNVLPSSMKNAVIASGVATVVESAISGTSGYRVWSDGTIENWGPVQSSVLFLKPYTDASTIMFTGGLTTGWNRGGWAQQVSSITTTGAYFSYGFGNQGGPGSGGQGWWYAIGK